MQPEIARMFALGLGVVHEHFGIGEVNHLPQCHHGWYPGTHVVNQKSVAVFSIERSHAAYQRPAGRQQGNRARPSLDPILLITLMRYCLHGLSQPTGNRLVL